MQAAFQRKISKDRAEDWLYPAPRWPRIIHKFLIKRLARTPHSVLTPENFNLVLQAVINPKIAQHGGVWSESKQQVIETADVHVSASPTETVSVQPDGTIQHGRKL